MGLGQLFSALSSVRVGCESEMCLPVCGSGGGSDGDEMGGGGLRGRRVWRGVWTARV